MVMKLAACVTRSCKHFQGAKGPTLEEDGEMYVCPAYPFGIPLRIVMGVDLHATVEHDQVGDLVYEKGPYTIEVPA